MSDDGDGGVVIPPGPGVPAGDVRVLAANDLGMHCIDREFSVFSILPPFNVVQAQVVRRTAGGRPVVLGPSDVTVTYEPVADSTGSINSTSLGGKTGFWTRVAALFGASLSPGQGLTGLYMPADAPAPGPQAMGVDAASGWFVAFGIPITPIDDAGGSNPFPLLRISARDASTGALLGSTDIVVPVAQETDCRNCHSTGASAASGGAVAWSANADGEMQAKENVLLLHDHLNATNLVGSQPVLCASCHYSPALDLAGAGPQGPQATLPTLSKAVHGRHSFLVGTADQTCYQCHPGRITQCQRGAMRTGGMECVDCHGTMSSVAGNRRPWTDMPQCGSCHSGDANSHAGGTGMVLAADGIRLRQAYRVGDGTATPLSPVTNRFAEEPGRLYRKSEGHGGLACTACHGSPHAIWPNADPSANDNVAANQLQGHAGTIAECSACHAAGTLGNTLGGPHGMHPVASASFIDGAHGHLYESNRASCTACHGADLTGTALSRATAARTFIVEDAGTVRFTKGQPVGCTHCHGNPAAGEVGD